MHEITETVNETANNAKRANEVVTTTRSDAEQSSDVVRRAVEAMNGIERSSSEISSQLGWRVPKHAAKTATMYISSTLQPVN